MTRSVKSNRIIDSGVDAVWAVLSNIGRTASYNPVVFESEGDDNARIGSSRRCAVNAAGTKWIEEQVVDSDDRRYTIEIVGGNGAPPMRTNVEIVAEPMSADSTSVTMTAHLHPAGALQTLMAIPATRMMSAVLGRVLDGLEHHLATGEEIDASFKRRG